jgi:hypothetical protein
MFDLHAFDLERCLSTERAFGQEASQGNLERMVRFDMYEKGFDPSNLDDVKTYWDILLQWDDAPEFDIAGEISVLDALHFAELERKLYKDAIGLSAQLVS